MSFLTHGNERSHQTTPAPSSVNVTVPTKSGDGHTNTRVGGMETVLEEGDVGNTEAQPEEHPKRMFRFGRRKGMPGRFLESHPLTSHVVQARPSRKKRERKEKSPKSSSTRKGSHMILGFLRLSSVPGGSSIYTNNFRTTPTARTTLIKSTTPSTSPIIIAKYQECLKREMGCIEPVEPKRRIDGAIL